MSSIYGANTSSRMVQFDLKGSLYNRGAKREDKVLKDCDLTRLGTKSLSSGYGVFLGDDCVATAESVNVFYDMKTRETVAPPDDVRDAMQKLLAEG